MREEDIKYRKRQKFMKLLKKAGLFVLGTVICAVVVIFSILIGAGLLGSNHTGFVRIGRKLYFIPAIIGAVLYVVFRMIFIEIKKTESKVVKTLLISLVVFFVSVVFLGMLLFVLYFLGFMLGII